MGWDYAINRYMESGICLSQKKAGWLIYINVENALVGWNPKKVNAVFDAKI